VAVCTSVVCCIRSRAEATKPGAVSSVVMSTLISGGVSGMLPSHRNRDAKQAAEKTALLLMSETSLTKLRLRTVEVRSRSINKFMKCCLLHTKPCRSSQARFGHRQRWVVDRARIPGVAREVSAVRVPIYILAWDDSTDYLGLCTPLLCN
jgi:hypothetical protein